jgi:hypothetical protein
LRHPNLRSSSETDALIASPPEVIDARELNPEHLSIILREQLTPSSSSSFAAACNRPKPPSSQSGRLFPSPPSEPHSGGLIVLLRFSDGEQGVGIEMGRFSVRLGIPNSRPIQNPRLYFANLR